MMFDEDEIQAQIEKEEKEIDDKSSMIIHKNGTVEYFIELDGRKVLHRLDGPAIEYSNGSVAYYVNGKLHREDGPAIDFVDGYREWYLLGAKYSEHEYEEACRELIRI